MLLKTSCSILFLVSIFLGTQAFSQGVNTTSPVGMNKDSLKNIYGNNKHFISGYELQSLIALSYYPELKETEITFRLVNIESIAKTTITFFSIFNSAEKHFIIYINSNKNRTGMLLIDAPFTAQVGAIGHELAHVANFSKKSLAGMVWWGINYLSKKHRIKIERKTDISTIAHGLGIELYSFVDFVLNSSSANEDYKKFKRLHYLSPAEIMEMVKNTR